MSDIDKTIEQVKGFDGKRTKGAFTVIEHECGKTITYQSKPFYRVILTEELNPGVINFKDNHPNDMVFVSESANSIMPIIAELEAAKKIIGEWQVVHRGLLASYKAELETANKRIAELDNELERSQQLVHDMVKDRA